MSQTPPSDNGNGSDKRQNIERRDFLQQGLTCSLVLPLTLAHCGESVEPADSLTDTKPPSVNDTSTPPDVPFDPQDWDNGTPLEEDPANLQEETLIFSMGVSAGAMTTDSVCFWGYTEDNAAKELIIWRDAHEKEGLVLVKKESLAPIDGYMKVTLQGFAPGTQYRYAFINQADGIRSAIGHVRTAYPAGSSPVITLAATACTHYKHMPYKSLLLTAKYDFDVFCHLGDMSYNDGSETQAEFRTKWRGALTAAGYQAILQKAGFYIAIDDHEITDNSRFYTVEEEVFKTGLEAFHEALPTPTLPNDRNWESYRWGDSVEIFVLDCRTERQVETRVTDTPIYISNEQMNWLKQGLSDSPCTFKVLVNSVPILGFSEVWPERSDRWQAYEEQREELLNHIRDEGISNVVVITGDYHMAYVARVENEGPHRDIWEIMVGPGAPRVPNPLVTALRIDPEAIPAFLPEGQFDYLSDRSAATLLEFHPETEEFRVRFLDAETEETLYDKRLKAGKNPA